MYRRNSQHFDGGGELEDVIPLLTLGSGLSRYFATSEKAKRLSD